ncbi:hypothetical protein CQW23_02218 [Capsicum baccatum]|uniref:Mitochondrial carnitine/acylcarnitine carrier-like protein n=1 Tax=Capsicum baccatum TaxID=33114 RepID=A0A2G2XQT1_CAPBA|nr:hypothetical protein CQW23_02218 [Capsicum baccatum]
MGDIAKDLTSGTIGGATQLIIGHPFDTIKVKLQSQPTPLPGQHPKYSGAIDAIRQTVAAKGDRGLFKDMGAPLATVEAFNAVLFIVRGQTEAFLRSEPGVSLTVKQQIVCGVVAGTAASFLACPTELIKCSLLCVLIRRRLVKSAKESIKQQGSNSEIFGNMQAVFIEINSSPDFVKKLKSEPPTKEMKLQLIREIAVEVLVNVACIMEKADETLLLGVYKEFGKDLHTDPTCIGSLTLFRSLVQCICYLLVVCLSPHYNRAHVITLGGFVWSAVTFPVVLSSYFTDVHYAISLYLMFN